MILLDGTTRYDPPLDDATVALLYHEIRDLLYGSGESLSACSELELLLREAVEDLLLRVRPRGVWALRSIRRNSGGFVEIDEGHLRSLPVSAYLESCEGRPQLLMMAVTLGHLSPQRDDLAYRYAHDRAGSVLAELLMGRMDERCRAEAMAEGLRSSRRFSPGFCDLDLKEQNVFDSVLNLESIGISLNASCVLVPEKSITAAAVAADRLPSASICAFCAKVECPVRREAKKKR